MASAWKTLETSYSLVKDRRAAGRLEEPISSVQNENEECHDQSMLSLELHGEALVLCLDIARCFALGCCCIRQRGFALHVEGKSFATRREREKRETRKERIL
jgi:hypothetical protein